MNLNIYILAVLIKLFTNCKKLFSFTKYKKILILNFETDLFVFIFYFFVI